VAPVTAKDNSVFTDAETLARIFSKQKASQ